MEKEERKYERRGGGGGGGEGKKGKGRKEEKRMRKRDRGRGKKTTQPIFGPRISSLVYQCLNNWDMVL